MKGKEGEVSSASQFFLCLVLEKCLMGQEVTDINLPSSPNCIITQLERQRWRSQTVCIQALALPLTNCITLPR